MTRSNLGKDKICLTCTSRPQSTTEGIQGKNFRNQKGKVLFASLLIGSSVGIVLPTVDWALRHEFPFTHKHSNLI